ncbi:unnamed protein product, partial [Effrenium voratum]
EAEAEAQAAAANHAPEAEAASKTNAEGDTPRALAGLIDFAELELAEGGQDLVRERCQQERAKECLKEPGRGRGQFYGLALPKGPAELSALGADWLNRAFCRAKTWPNEREEASKLVSLRPLSAGKYLMELSVSHRRMLLLEVTFFQEGRNEESLADLLRPKAGASFADGINFLRLLESEVSRSPKFLFGDSEGSSGLLITEWSGATWADVSFCRWPRWSRQSCFVCPAQRENLCLTGGSVSGSVSVVGLSTKTQGAHMLWTLEWTEEGLWQLLSGQHPLAALGAQPQALAFGSRAKRQELWTLRPGPGGEYFIQSFYETYLAHSGNAVFLSPSSRNALWRLESYAEYSEASHRRLDLRGPDGDGLDLATMQKLVDEFAALAGRCAQQKVPLDGLDEKEVRQKWQRRHQQLQCCDSPRAKLGFQDAEFLDKASTAQEFITRLAAQLFPTGVNKQMMKDYRAALVTARVNFFAINTYLSVQLDYSACGLDSVDFETLYLDDNELGIQSWKAMSDGPLGLKLWRWLILAQPKALEHTDSLLERFISGFAAAGGKLLEKEKLLWHVLLAASLHSVELLAAVPLLLDRISKEEWPSVKSWTDPRLFGGEPTGGLWLILKAFVSVAVVTRQYDLVNRMVVQIPDVLGAHQMAHLYTAEEADAKKWTGAYFSHTEVRAEASADSELLAILPADCPGCVKEEDPEGFAEICFPFQGYIPWSAVRLCDPKEMPTKAEDYSPAFELVSLMYHTRRQYTGSSGPLFMDEISAKKLCDEIFLREKASGLLRRLGHGHCSVVHGSFLAETASKSWWPPKYQDWAYHSFVAFEDGHIADLTADQFDVSVPQLWYPADPSRYDRSSHPAEAARFARQVTIGLEKWRSFMEKERKSAPRRIYEWWDAEMKGGFDVRHGQQGQVLRCGKPLTPPEPCKVAWVKERKVSFRRLTDATELEVYLVEGLFDSFELQRLLGFCEQRQGFQPSLQKDKRGQVVQDGRRTSHSCAMRWKLLGDEGQEETFHAQNATERCAAALGVEA